MMQSIFRPVGLADQLAGPARKVLAYIQSPNGARLMAFLFVAALLAVPGAASFASSPSLNIDFAPALDSIFYYATMIFSGLIGIVAIGIGFQFGIGLLNYVGKMITQALP